MGKNLMPVLGGLGIAGLAAMTGGASLPGSLAAAEGAGAAGVGGAVLGGDALAAQGAAGLLGTAGAEAAGYGGASLLGGALPEIAGTELANVGPLTQGSGADAMTSFGPNNEYWGKSITDGTGMTSNSFTGGFDGMNGMERFGQRLESMMDGGGSNNLSKAFKFMKNGQQQPQQAQGGGGGGAPRPMMQQQSQPMRSPYDPLPQYDEEQLRRMYGGY